MAHKQSVGTQVSGCRSQWVGAGLKKWHKRQSNKKFRRMAKEDPEGAPRKRSFFYWLD